MKTAVWYLVDYKYYEKNTICKSFIIFQNGWLIEYERLSPSFFLSKLVPGIGTKMAM